VKIIQITDLHIDVEGELPFDIDVRQNFLKIIEKIKTLEPGHLVISGDLCYRDGDKSIYNWIKKVVDETKIPYSVISGNHDDSTLMAKAFELEHLMTDDELFFAKKIGKSTFLFLDSSKGYHSANQLNWLKRQLKNAKDDLFVFMHHPPILAGVPFMDGKYALKDIKDVQEIFFAYPNNINIFTGHYHVEKSIRINNLLIQITPSLFFQIDQESVDFKVDHHFIALREIVIENNHFSSTLKYFSGFKKHLG
jgi:Icc protein